MNLFVGQNDILFTGQFQCCEVNATHPRFVECSRSVGNPWRFVCEFTAAAEAAEASQNFIQRLHNAMSLVPANSSVAFCCGAKIQKWG